MKQLTFTLWLVFLLCGCAPKRAELPRPLTPVGAAVTRARFVVPELPQAAAVVPSEVALPVSMALPMWRIHRAGALFASQFDNQVLFWNANLQFQLLTLSQWNTPFGEADFALTGNTLAVSSLRGGVPHPLQEYVLSGWDARGLPTVAVFVTNLTYSTTEGRWTRAVATARGGIVFATTRHTGGWMHDLAYRSPSGRWFTYFRQYTPNDSIPSFNFEMMQGADGLIYLFTLKDSGGKITLARWAETDSGLAFVDFNENFLGKDQTAVDYEMPWLQIAGTNLSYQTSYGSVLGCWWRLAHPVIVGVDVQPPMSRPRILYHRLDQQNVDLDWVAQAGQTYRPEASADLANWTAIQTWRWVESPGRISVSGFNPFYNQSANVFLAVRPMNYSTTLRAMLPDYVERSQHRLPMVQHADHLTYFISPMDANCEMTNTFQRTLGQAKAVEQPIDYVLVSVGEGYAIVRRGEQFYLKRLS